MDKFSYDSPIFTFLSTLFNLVMLNALFLITCIPVFTIGASISALYYTVFHMQEGDDAHLIRKFLSSWKDTFKKSTPVWLVSIAFLFFVRTNIIFLSQLDPSMLKNILFAAQLVVFFLLLCVLIYYFSLHARFENTIKNTLKNAVLLSVTHLPVTIACLCFGLIFPAIIFFVPHFSPYALMLFILFGVSGICYLQGVLLLQVYRKF